MFELRRGEKVIVRDLVSLDSGKVRVSQPESAIVFDADEIRGENARVYVDPIGKKAYFVG